MSKEGDKMYGLHTKNIDETMHFLSVYDTKKLAIEALNILKEIEKVNKEKGEQKHLNDLLKKFDNDGKYRTLEGIRYKDIRNNIYEFNDGETIVEIINEPFTYKNI